MTIQIAPLISGVGIVSTTSAASGYPNSRLVSIDPPDQPWRSTDRSQQDLIFNLGAAYGSALANPNVVTDLSSWSISDAARVTRATASPPSGFTAYIHIDDNTSGATHFAYQDYAQGVDLRDRSFKLTFQARAVSGANSVIHMQFLDQNGTVLSEQTQAVSSGSWNQYSLTATAPANTWAVRALFDISVAGIGVADATGFQLQIGWQAIALFYANFPQVQVAGDDNSGMTSPTSLPGSPFAISVDQWDDAAKLWVNQAVYEQYVRVRIPGVNAGYPVTRGNVNYYQLGSVLFADRVYSFTANSAGLGAGGQPKEENGIDLTITKPTIKADAGGRTETAAAGPLTLTEEWRTLMSTSLIDDWRRIGILGPETPFLVYRNKNNTQEIYLRHYEDSQQWNIKSRFYEASMRLQQW